jgi:hypothetical protein
LRTPRSISRSYSCRVHRRLPIVWLAHGAPHGTPGHGSASASSPFQSTLTGPCFFVAAPVRPFARPPRAQESTRSSHRDRRRWEVRLAGEQRWPHVLRASVLHRWPDHPGTTPRYSCAASALPSMVLVQSVTRSPRHGNDRVVLHSRDSIILDRVRTRAHDLAVSHARYTDPGAQAMIGSRCAAWPTT